MSVGRGRACLLRVELRDGFVDFASELALEVRVVDHVCGGKVQTIKRETTVMNRKKANVTPDLQMKSVRKEESCPATEIRDVRACNTSALFRTPFRRTGPNSGKIGAMSAPITRQSTPEDRPIRFEVYQKGSERCYLDERHLRFKFNVV